jgi:hypothetical protein
MVLSRSGTDQRKIVNHGSDIAVPPQAIMDVIVQRVFCLNPLRLPRLARVGIVTAISWVTANRTSRVAVSEATTRSSVGGTIRGRVWNKVARGHLPVLRLLNRAAGSRELPVHD